MYFIAVKLLNISSIPKLLCVLFFQCGHVQKPFCDTAKDDQPWNILSLTSAKIIF